MPFIPDTGPEQRAAWAMELESGDMETRLNTILQLAHPGDIENIRLLIASLENTSWRTRHAAFDALVALGGPAVPFLIEALTDSHEHVVISSVIALGAIRAREAVGPLITLLDSGGDPALFAAWTLGEIGDDQAVTPLTKLLNSGDARLRTESEQALRKFG